MKGGVLVVAVMVDGSKCILTNLDDRWWFDEEFARKRAGLMVLDSFRGETHPAARLILSGWVESDDMVQRLTLPKQNTINMMASLLRDQDARFKVWRAEFDPGRVKFELVTRKGEVQLHTLELTLYRSCFLGEISMIMRDEPEVVLRYRQRPGEKVWVGVEIAGIIRVQAK